MITWTTPTLMITLKGVRSRSVMEGMPMEVMTIGDWLEHVSGE